MNEVQVAVGAAEVWEAIANVLLADPITNNVALTVLASARDRGERTSRAWWVADDTTADGDSPGSTAIAFQGASGDPVGVMGSGPGPLSALAAAALDDVPRLERVVGEVGAASRFAAEWCARVSRRLVVAELNRFVRLDPDQMVTPTEQPEGGLRVATSADLPLLFDWAVAFQHDVFGPGPVDRDGLEATMTAEVAKGVVWLWDDGSPVSMASATVPIGATSRIRHVYTPPDQRGRGLAAACVAAVVDEAARMGADHTVLYADLANPTSNGVYHRLGYRTVHIAANLDLSSPA